ncbi:kelch repeat-containing protein [Micromonospora sp. SL1-18]|uniref:kelch repeat-containing protein n=1 Tax=Micromonospora sp. SL1-18 TaxID=3399128 RepID=UPI003A4D39AD
MVNLGGKVYSIGGSDERASSAKSWVYDPFAQNWTPIADLPGARHAMAVGVVDRKIIVTGGWVTPAGPEGTTWSYDPATNTWTKKAENPRRAAVEDFALSPIRC